MQNLKVLLVEDIDIARKLAVYVLRSIKCDVTVATNGNEALSLSDSNHFNLILMDIGLPDIDGLEVTKKIRDGNNKNKKSVIIALTAHDTSEYRTKCLEIGMDNFIGKPLNKEKLTAALKELQNTTIKM